METEIKEGRKEEGQAEPGSVNGLPGPFQEPPVGVCWWGMEEKVKVEVNKKDEQAPGNSKNFNGIIRGGACETWKRENKE